MLTKNQIVNKKPFQYQIPLTNSTKEIVFCVKNVLPFPFAKAINLWLYHDNTPIIIKSSAEVSND